MLDFSADVDCNQNNIKNKAFFTSCTLNHSTDYTYSEKCDYFPVPDSDPFKDDPLSKIPAQSTSEQSMDTSSSSNITAGNVSSNNVVHMDPELFSKTVIVAVRNGHGSLADKVSNGSTKAILDSNDLELSLSSSNPFFENTLNLSHKHSPCTRLHSKSVFIGPPPQNTKARRRRSTKVNLIS